MYASLNLLHFVYTTDISLSITLFDWMVVGSLNIPLDLVDHKCCNMMTVVTVVSTMVHIHSIGYMDTIKDLIDISLICIRIFNACTCYV